MAFVDSVPEAGRYRGSFGEAIDPRSRRPSPADAYRSLVRFQHRLHVRNALFKGQPVLREILRDYPEIA
jgi:hypothetical protein